MPFLAAIPGAIAGATIGGGTLAGYGTALGAGIGSALAPITGTVGALTSGIGAVGTGMGAGALGSALANSGGGGGGESAGPAPTAPPGTAATVPNEENKPVNISPGVHQIEQPAPMPLNMPPLATPAPNYSLANPYVAPPVDYPNTPLEIPSAVMSPFRRRGPF